MDPENRPGAQQLVDALCGQSPTYKRKAVEAVVARQEETIPLLLDVLRAILRDPEGYLAELGEDFDPLYVMAILAHLRTPEAHDLFIALCQLSEEQFELLFGGFITEGMERALFATCHGRTEGMRALLEDREADGYLRSQAAHALAMAAHHGWAERGEVLDFLARQFTPQKAPLDSHFWSGVGSAMLELYPEDHVDVLIKAFDEGLIEPMMFDRTYIEEVIAEGPQRCQERLAEDVARALTPDMHHWIGWWACFDDPQRSREKSETSLHQMLQALIAPEPVIPEKTSKTPAKIKKARKHQRSARKKQRRKKKRKR